MKYLGTIRNENGTFRMPDGFDAGGARDTYEVIAVGDDILFIADPLDRKRLESLLRLTKNSIEDHRESLDGLAK